MESQIHRASSLLCKVTGFFLAFQVCVTFLFFQADPQMGTAVTVSMAIVWLLVVTAYSGISLSSEHSHSIMTTPLVWIALYLGLAAASLLWTGASSIMAAAGYWSAVTADVAIIYLLLRYEPAEQNAEEVMRGFILGAAAVAVIAWVSPAMDDMRLGNEEYMHPNLIGFDFAIAALLASHLAQRNRKWSWVVGGLVVTLLRTLSKAAIVGFACAGLYYLLRGLRISRKARFYIGAMSTLVIMSFWGLVEAYLDLYTDGTNLETITGRTYIWTQSLEIALEKPWIGHGFDSFRRIFPPFNDFQPWQAHNELLQQFFAYGVIGILVVVGLYWALYKQIRLTPHSAMQPLAMAILILVLIRGLVDTDRFELCCPLWLVTLLSVSLASDAVARPSVPA